MVALTSHSSSRADPTRRAVMRIPTLVQRVFGSDTVWRDHSFTSLVSAHANRTVHGEVRSPCTVRSARHNEKRGELGPPCVTDLGKSDNFTKFQKKSPPRKHSEKASFNGVRGLRPPRASGALAALQLLPPLLHGFGESARCACAASGSQLRRRSDQRSGTVRSRFSRESDSASRARQQ